MQFNCDQCGAAYRIADEKLAGRQRALLFTCKHCQNKIPLQPLPAAPAPAPLAPLMARQATHPGFTRPVPPPPLPPPPPPEEAVEWFARMSGKTLGPMSFDELSKMVLAGQIGQRTFVWMAEMPEWRRATEVREIAALLAPAGRKEESVAPPAPPDQAEPKAPVPEPVPVAAAPEKPGKKPRRGKKGKSEPVAAVEPPPPAEAKAPEPEPVAVPVAVAVAPPVAGHGTAPAPATPPAAPARPLADLVGEPPGDPDTEALAEWASFEAATNVVTEPGHESAPPTADPFARVPDSPSIVKSGPHEISEVTRAIIARAGVHRSPARLIAGAGLAAGAIVAAVWILNSEAREAPPEVAQAPLAPPVAAPAPSAPSREVLGLGSAVASAPEKPPPAGRLPKAAPAPVAVAAEPAGTLRPKDEAKKPAPAISASQADELAALYGDATRKEHVFKLPAESSPQVDTTAAALEAGVIAKVIGNYMPSLQGCIEAELRRRPDFKGGKVRITATVRPSGTVGAASVDNRKVDATPLGECFKDRARRMVFPAFQGEAFDVEIPLVVGASQ